MRMHTSSFIYYLNSIHGCGVDASLPQHVIERHPLERRDLLRCLWYHSRVTNLLGGQDEGVEIKIKRAKGTHAAALRNQKSKLIK